MKTGAESPSRTFRSAYSGSVDAARALKSKGQAIGCSKDCLATQIVEVKQTGFLKDFGHVAFRQSPHKAHRFPFKPFQLSHCLLRYIPGILIKRRVIVANDFRTPESPRMVNPMIPGSTIGEMPGKHKSDDLALFGLQTHFYGQRSRRRRNGVCSVGVVSEFSVSDKIIPKLPEGPVPAQLRPRSPVGHLFGSGGQGHRPPIDILRVHPFGGHKDAR